MSIDAIGAYSADVVYGQLTSPFTPKQITINAHTPYDKVDENESKVYSREHFNPKPQAKMVYELPEDDNKKLNNFSSKANGAEEKTDVQDKTIDVATFQASKISSKDIVTNSLKHGYTPEQAVVVQKAQNAYKNSAIATKNPAKVLSNHSYQVV